MLGFGGRRGPRRRPARSGSAPRPRREEADESVLQTVVRTPGRQAPTVRGAARDLRPRLVDLGVRALAMVYALRQTTVAPDPARVRAEWTACRADLEERAREHGHRADDVAACVYLLCAMIDGAVLGFPEVLDAWFDAGALQYEFDASEELLAGDRVFVRLADMRTAPERWVEALEFYHACFVMGYRGRYLDDEAGMNALLAELGAEITAVRGDGTLPLSPNASRHEGQAGEVVRKAPAWVMPVALAGALVVAWVVVALVSFLHAGSVLGAIGRP